MIFQTHYTDKTAILGSPWCARGQSSGGSQPGFSIPSGIILSCFLSTQRRLAVCTTHRLVRIEIRSRGGQSCSRVEVKPIDLCIPHQCQCGSPVDARGFHSFVCRRASGRSARHHALNDLVARCFASAGTPVTKEPTRLFRTDGKRPDGLTLVPWQSGKSLCWNVTVICPLVESYVTGSAREAGAAAKLAASPRLRNDLYCVEWGVKLYSLTHSPLLAKRKICQHWKRIPLCAHRGRNLGPDEHIGMPTVCQSGKKVLLGLRR